MRSGDAAKMSVETIEGTWPLVKAGGEIDLSNIDDLRSACDAAIARSPKAFVIDFTDIDYIDSAGVAVVISAYRRVSKAGGVLAIVRPRSPAVRRVLDLIGLHSLPSMVVADDVESAEEWLSDKGTKPGV
jgi:anti-anti-sigma factor